MRGTHCDQDRAFERRKIAALSELLFLLEIAGKIVVARELNRGTERRVSLHENFARGFAASGASGDLGEKLKRAFARSEVRQMQGKVGIDDSNQRHVWKMQAFRNHLCADEDIDLTGTKISQRFAIRFLARHRVGVHSAHDRFWENLGDRCFDFLGAESVIDQRVLSACRAFLWYGRGMAAQMTAQSSG